MKNEDLEKLSLDSFDENEFMLNDKKDDSIIIDDMIDSKEETNLSEEVEVMEEIAPILPKREVSHEVQDNTNKKKEKHEKRETRQKRKSKGFKIPSDKKDKLIYLIQALFCILSIIFIFGCCIFYGSRLIKYYRIYNPKTEGGEVIELIGSSITNSTPYVTEGEGLYRIGGASIFKGDNVNNYLYFANEMWRIVTVNADGSLEVTTDKYINALSFNDEAVAFNKSNLNKYLNEVFLKTLNMDYLSQTAYCLDEVEDIASITCKDIVSTDYVRILGVSEFLNSKVEGKSYLSSEDGYWIYNTSSEGAWHTSGVSLSLSSYTEGYLVKPVVRIKNSVQLLGGKGSLNDPYYIEKDDKNLEVGNYVKLANDVWVIYEVKENTINLALNNTISATHRFSSSTNKYDVNDKNGIASYLNTTYLENLTYKDMLNDNEWYTGAYDYNYENIYKTEITSKVGIYNVADLKINNSSEIFYLMTPSETNYAYLYNMGLSKSKITLARNIKPTININKLPVESGKGTINDPYVLGA